MTMSFPVLIRVAITHPLICFPMARSRQAFALLEGTSSRRRIRSRLNPGPCFCLGPANRIAIVVVTADVHEMIYFRAIFFGLLME